MITRRIILVLATAALALTAAAAVPGQAHAVSFVDKQVQAGSLLLQKYINDYGVAHRFTYPPKSMVKKGRGLTAPIWPANPWTGRIMAPGTSRGTYTYTRGAGGSSYRLVVHLSRGNYRLSGGMPKWFKSERNTASRQNVLLLQRYIEAWAATNGGAYPYPADLTPVTFGTSFAWPRNPWTGALTAAGNALGDFNYAGGGATYALKAMLTTGWSSAFRPIPVIGQLSTSPGD